MCHTVGKAMNNPRLFLSHSGKDRELAWCFYLTLLHGCQLGEDDVRFTMNSPGEDGCSVDVAQLIKEIKKAELVTYLLTPSWRASGFFVDELKAGLARKGSRLMIFRCCGQDQANAPEVVQNMTMWDGCDADQIRGAVQHAARLLRVELNDDSLHRGLTKLAATISKARSLDYDLQRSAAERLDG